MTDHTELKRLLALGSLPPCVGELIAENERLREDPGMRAIRSLRGDCADLIVERDQLKAENAQLKNQEIELKTEVEVLRKSLADLLDLHDIAGRAAMGNGEQ